MDEHPGNTLGKRFLSFWGTVGAVIAFGVAIYVVKGLFGPSSGDPLDGGQSGHRLEKKALVDKEQTVELDKYAVDKAKNVATLPPAEVFTYAVSVIAQEKATKSKTPVPGAAPAATPGTGVHDPNESFFRDGK
jgi:hypothetical protein